MFSHPTRSRSPASAQLLARRAKETSLSLVCHRWRRVVVPITHETVIYSPPEANTFVYTLRRVGLYIKKLRIEDMGSLFTQFSWTRVHLCLLQYSFKEKNKAGGLCRGLKLINPNRPNTSSFLNMASVWSNLVGVPLVI